MQSIAVSLLVNHSYMYKYNNYSLIRGQDVSDFEVPDVILMADVVYYEKVYAKSNNNK